MARPKNQYPRRKIIPHPIPAVAALQMLAEQYSRAAERYNESRLVVFVPSKKCPIQADRQNEIWEPLYENLEDIEDYRWRKARVGTALYQFDAVAESADHFMRLDEDFSLALTSIPKIPECFSKTSPTVVACHLGLLRTIPLLRMSISCHDLDNNAVGDKNLPLQILELTFAHNPFSTMKAAIDGLLMPNAWQSIAAEKKGTMLRLLPFGNVVEQFAVRWAGGKEDNRRSYTQRELDNAILQYKAERADRYETLVEKIKKGSPGAKKAAQEMFGQRVIAGILGAKARSMVGKSQVWQEIAKELNLRHGSKEGMRHRMSLDKAMEQKAVACSESCLNTASKKETIRRIRQTMADKYPDAADDLIHRLESGEQTPEEIDALLENFESQQQDYKIRRLPSRS